MGLNETNEDINDKIQAETDDVCEYFDFLVDNYSADKLNNLRRQLNDNFPVPPIPPTR